jgi:DNA-binding response OmpR family regulator
MVRVLVIDDDELVRDFLRVALESEGFDVTQAADGPAGVKMCQEDPPDIALMDQIMPGQGGIETAMQIRACAPNVKIIGMSGAAAEPRSSEKLRTHGWLSKPFTPEELVAVVRSVLAENSGHS